MLINSPKNIALFNAILLALISGVILILISIYVESIDITIIMVIIAVIFISSFFLINFSISKFFHEKIDIIYKTIGEPQTTMKAEKKNKNSNDVLDLVNQVVLRWSEEKKQEINELKQMASYRREFLGNVSHELKTPVFNIQGYVDTLLEGGLEDKTINVKFLQKTQNSVNRMIALVEDLEEISKLESVNLELNVESFNLYELATEVIDFMEHKALLNKTKIIINPIASKSIKVLADIRRIRQVMINLIDNAIKYGKMDDPVVTISFYNFHDNYLIEIQDNGIGMPEENLVRVFERFYRTEESRSRDKGGMGLGLAIVKHIIEAHRQTISVRSNLGEGTTFSFTLKMA